MLLSEIENDLKQAQLERRELEVSVLRMLLSEIKYLKIQKGVEELEDKDLLQVIQKELKKRKEAEESFKTGGRMDSAEKEGLEAKILEKYLPEQISDSELETQIDEAIRKTGASSMQDMGKVIGMVMANVGSGADGLRVSSMIKNKLAS